jgi:hemolysin activation/secretion protein
VRWTLAAEHLAETPLAVHATPYSGDFRPAFNATPFTGRRARLALSVNRMDAPLGATLSGTVTASAGWRDSSGAPAHAGPARFGRVAFSLSADRRIGDGTLSLAALGAAVSDPDAPAQDQVLFGGPVTGPGYSPHSLDAQSGLSVRAEWQRPVGTFTLPLGRFGRTAVPVIIVPFAQGVWLSGSIAPAAAAQSRSAGVGLLTLHELIRFDVARGFDRGGHWVFYADFGKAFWRVL